MSDKPILFSAPMVRAILDGRKTQSRRTIKDQTLYTKDDRGVICWTGFMGWQSVEWAMENRGAVGRGILPRWMPGDRLWVRETFWQVCRYPGTLPSGEPEPNAWCWGDKVHYAADGDPPNTPNRHYPGGLRGKSFAAPDPWAVWIKRPSTHMPRRYCRLFPEVVSVRVERLQDITEADAIAEGVSWDAIHDGWTSNAGIDGTVDYHGANPTRSYEKLWDRINGPGSWEANPWVAAIEFRRMADAE